MPQVRTFPATVVKVHDGDSISVDCDLGFHIEYTISVRLYGCNAPELNTAAGKAARAHLLTLAPIGSKVTVTSYGPDKYGGRWDCTITLPDGSDVAERLIAAGHAARWDGRGVKPVPPEAA